MWRQSVFRIVLAGTLGTAAALAAPAQDSPATPVPVFRAQSDLVVMHVNVFDGHSDAVPNLPREAFLVIEDDTPQDITFFSSADVPVAVGLVIDNSSSMLTRRGMVLAGGTTFAASSHPQDELFTVIFNEHVRYGLPPTLSFTTSESVIAALDHLDKSSLQKHVLVVLSDGDDNASSQSEKAMLERARRSDAIVYTVSSANDEVGPRGNPGVLKKLAEATGGLALFPKSDAAVVTAFDEIATNIRRGYSIGYVPTNGARDGAFRTVKVMVRMRGRNNLSVRSRHGYTAPGAE
jgi:hypothetical protein